VGKRGSIFILKVSEVPSLVVISSSQSSIHFDVARGRSCLKVIC
jgi:hypothetical protein